MLIYKGHFYREAISIEDKRKKREWQFDQKLQERLETEQRDGDWIQDIATDIFEYYKVAYPEKLVDYYSGELTPDQSELVWEEATDMVFDTYYEEDLRSEAVELLPSEYKQAVEDAQQRVSEAEKALDEIIKLHGSDSEEAQEAQNNLDDAEYELDKIREEVNQQTEDTGTWDKVIDAYRDKFLPHVINKHFTTKKDLYRFIENRAAELLQMEGQKMWRAVVMESNKDPTKYTSLGLHWVTDKKLARPFLSQIKQERWKDPMVVVYEGIIPDVKYIDIHETIKANVWAFLVGVIKFGNYTDLNEVRFIPHTPIKITSVGVSDMDVKPDLEGTYSVDKVIPINDWRRA